jgi:hypothetical protein
MIVEDNLTQARLVMESIQLTKLGEKSLPNFAKDGYNRIDNQNIPASIWEVIPKRQVSLKRKSRI